MVLGYFHGVLYLVIIHIEIEDIRQGNMFLTGVARKNGSIFRDWLFLNFSMGLDLRAGFFRPNTIFFISIK